ncbi:OmpA family protein [Methylotetracoccus oryzae]|uniref:OmpA family protein n=1 Tax=Methylotetracoccus oryzae TaxID=1919059 RepID=UPI0038B2FAF7
MGSTAIDETGQHVISNAISAIRTQALTVAITGYTDRTGNAVENIELAKQHAVAVRIRMPGGSIFHRWIEGKRPDARMWSASTASRSRFLECRHAPAKAARCVGKGSEGTARVESQWTRRGAAPRFGAHPVSARSRHPTPVFVNVHVAHPYAALCNGALAWEGSLTGFNQTSPMGCQLRVAPLQRPTPRFRGDHGTLRQPPDRTPPSSS